MLRWDDQNVLSVDLGKSSNVKYDFLLISVCALVLSSTWLLKLEKTQKDGIEFQFGVFLQQKYRKLVLLEIMNRSRQKGEIVLI